MAQQVTSSVDLQGTRLRYADTVDAAGPSISPSLRLDWSHATVSAYGTYAQLAHAWSADGSASASVFTPTWRGWSGEIAGTVGGSTHQDGTRTAATTGVGRLHLDGSHVGAWVGAGIGSTSDGFVWRGVREGEAGLWMALGPGIVTLAGNPTVVDDSIRYTDLSAEGSWHAGRLELDALMGNRAGARLPSIASNVRTWANASAALWLEPRVAIVASAGTYPVDYTQGFPGGRFASVGVRIALTPRATRTVDSALVIPAVPTAPGITSFRIEPGTRGTRVIRVRATGTPRTVEIMGDLTGWKPVPLAPAGGGWYTVALHAGPGSYQIVLRTNGGEWGPPPGTPTVHDEFGGTTGVVIVE
jgi:hypothetical protein